MQIKGAFPSADQIPKYLNPSKLNFKIFLPLSFKITLFDFISVKTIAS